MPPRVVLIHNFLAPYRIPLFAELAKRFDLEVWILGDIRKIREWNLAAADMPFACRQLPGRTIRLGSRYNALMLNYTLPRELQTARADVVIGCGWDSPAAFYCGMWARKSQRRFILWSGSTPAEKSMLRSLTAPAVRWLVRSADTWIADGTRAATYLASLGADAHRIFPAFNAVDNAYYARASRDGLEEASAMRSRWKLGDGPIILYIGNLLALKGVFELVEAFAAFHAGIRSARLVIAGSGRDETELRHRCNELKIAEHVVFTGFLDADAVARWYGIADLLVLPSRYEIWGMVINEALASGLPVLATDICGATADLIEDGVNGYTVPARNPKAIADAMRRHFENPDRHQAMREAARRKIAPFTFESAANAFEAAVCSAHL